MTNPPGNAPENPLLALRAELDGIDEQIVHLIARRQGIIAEVARAKASRAGGIRDQERERQLLARVEAIAQSVGVAAPLARKIFSELIEHSVSKQAATLSAREPLGREVAVGLQGHPHTYDDLAAQKYLANAGLRGRFVNAGTLTRAVGLLQTREIDLAFLPIENTFAGSINQVYDLLRERDVHIVGEETLKIEHCLIASEDVELGSLTRVLSHPSVLDQCSGFLESLPHVRATACHDTGEAVRLVAEARDPQQAAIAAPEAAAAHDLFIVRRGIGNQDEILSRFVALANAPAHVDPRVPCKVSLILATRHEQGALLTCMQILASFGLSLTKLESRPRPNRPWEYMFFIDFEGHIEEPRVVSALEALRARALFLKVLGCYPARATPTDAQAPAVRPARPVKEAGPSPRLVERASRAEDTVVRIGDLLVGGPGFVIITSPADASTPETIDSGARMLRERGAHVLHAPRASGSAALGDPAVAELWVAAGKRWGLPLACAVEPGDDLRLYARWFDLLQVRGAHLSNAAFLSELARIDRPVLLHRSVGTGIDEWLAAAEALVAQGNGQVILCDGDGGRAPAGRGRPYDVAELTTLAERTHLPVLVEPAAFGPEPRRMESLTVAALAVGAQGALLAVNLGDKASGAAPETGGEVPAALSVSQFEALIERLGRMRSS